MRIISEVDYNILTHSFFFFLKNSKVFQYCNLSFLFLSFPFLYFPSVRMEEFYFDSVVHPDLKQENLAVVENPSVILAREKMKRIRILTEKAKVEKKIVVIDEQKRKILDDFKERHGHGK